MGTAGIKTKVSLDGEKEYKQALSEINSGLRVLQSDMQLTTEAFADNADSVEALTAKGDVLERQILSQRDKISTLQAALKSSAQSYGESDKRTQDWQVSLNKAQTELLQMERKLRDNQKALNDATEAENDNRTMLQQMGDALRDTMGSSKSLGDVIIDLADKVGVKLPDGAEKAIGALGSISGKAAILTGAAGAAAAALVKIEKALIGLTKERAGAAATLSNISQTIGMSVEATQEWDYVLKTVGSSIETAQGDLSAFQERMQDAAAGTGEASELFDKLGISVQDNVTGQLRGTEDVLLDTIHALQDMSDVTDRNAVSSKLLGGTGEALIPIYNQNAEALDFLLQKKHELGILTGDEVERLKDVTESLLDYEERINAAQDALATQMAPSTAHFYDVLGEGLLSVGESAKESGIINYFGSWVELASSLMPLLDLLGQGLEALGPIFTIHAMKLAMLADGWTIATNAAAALVDIVLHGVPALFGGTKLKTDKYLGNIGDVLSGDNSATKRAWENAFGSKTPYEKGYEPYASFTGEREYDYYNASGTDNFPGGYTWVGENGPERVWLPQGTKIQSAQESRMSGGGDVFYVTIDAKNVKDFEDVVEAAQSERRRKRMG